MADFNEIWELRNRLMQDGFYTEDEDDADGVIMEQKIWKLAREHYNWNPPSPENRTKNSEIYEKFLKAQTPTSRLNHIYDIAIDWDGYRSVRGLGGLIDEIINCTIPPCISDHEALEQIKIAKLYKDIPDFLKAKLSAHNEPFTWNYDFEDVDTVYKWCDDHSYKYIFNCINYATDGTKIGCSITITKEKSNYELI